MLINWREIEEKWRKEWELNNVFNADPNYEKPKFFITVAYPYPNSPQHIGHGRTYTLTDVYARFLRMKGYNVLFPMAFHYTGTPILAMAKRLKENDTELIETFINIYKIPKDKLKDFIDPIKIAEYFHNEIKLGMKEMGYSIDWRREFTTIDPQYSRFIEWQFNNLKEKGLITQGSHPVGWCPKCENPVGQHDTFGDVEPEIGEFTLLKFYLNNFVLPAATLRPETIFGVTNIWVNPEAEYVEAKVENEEWIISKECAEKLFFLNKKVNIKNVFKGKELLGKMVLNPATGKEIPILPASFVNPKNATGIVMSVPAHAPYDYQALEDLKNNSDELKKYNLDSKLIFNITPISIIKVEGFSDIPALDAIKKRGIKNQNDPKLEEATSEVYSKEFHSGIMKENTRQYAGLPVAIAKEKVKSEFIISKKADVMYELLNKPVICRCGTECVVKIFENQWFINYGDPEWKKLAKECLAYMRIFPEEIRQEFEYTIDWLKEKACARKSGLGTKLPWDKNWIIESLSDSVIYMAYYTIAKHIKTYGIDAEKLTKEVFDYIFLSKGDVTKVAESSKLSVELLNDMKKEFEYFYPLDSRHSGRDLIPNHLTFFIFNHAAIFPRKYWPKQIVVNGSVLMEGKKMSKSLGNIIPLREAIVNYGADALRISILATAGLLQDVDFSVELAKSIKFKLEKFYQWALEVLKLQNKAYNENLTNLTLEDKWLLTKLHKSILYVTNAMENLRFRDALQIILYELDQYIQWYLKRLACNPTSFNEAVTAKILNEVLEARVKMLAPFAPYICEEIWHKLGNRSFISTVEWPKLDESKIDEASEEAVNFINNVLDDIKNILKVTKIKPKLIVCYTCSEWKKEAYKKVLELALTGKIEVKDLINLFVKNKHKEKDRITYISKIIKDISVMPFELKNRRLKAINLNEIELLKGSIPFYEAELKAKVEVYNEDDLKKYDPKNKAQLAQPFRPSIYIE
ncbi:MAG: leucine--tRNA ligase [Candidatus Bathyarchaeia archaeon]